VGIIMTDAAVEYRAEAFRRDRLQVEVAVDAVQTQGCDFVYLITRTDDIVKSTA
jgi:acyl-CoA thioester hydrolase